LNDGISAGSGESGKNRPRRRNSSKKMINKVLVAAPVEENKKAAVMPVLGQDIQTVERLSSSKVEVDEI